MQTSLRGGANLGGAGKEGQLVSELAGAQIAHACDALLVGAPLPTCARHSHMLAPFARSYHEFLQAFNTGDIINMVHPAHLPV